MHYLYRALLFPVLQPSMSPIHIIVWALGLMFQLTNSTCIGSWLAAYGPTTKEAWDAQPFMYLRFAVGAVVFFMGLLANYYHDDELRQIRWRQMKRVQQLEREKGDNNDGKKPTIEKHYEVPNAGFFRRVLYAHYLVEWIEWTGFWIACGWSCVPARMFVINEVAAMLPRAVRGRRWYAEKFGEDAIKGRWAALPGII